MSRKRFSVEPIMNHLREAEVLLAQGNAVGEICRHIGVSEQSYYRWRREYSGLKVDQARRLKDLEQENSRLKRAVADLTLDKPILKEAAEGNWKAPSAADAVCAMSSRSIGSRNGVCAACLANPAPASATKRSLHRTRVR
jgi:transposase-like protein